jgi:hypothetical protein
MLLPKLSLKDFIFEYFQWKTYIEKYFHLDDFFNLEYKNQVFYVVGLDSCLNSKFLLNLMEINCSYK